MSESKIDGKAGTVCTLVLAVLLFLTLASRAVAEEKPPKCDLKSDQILHAMCDFYNSASSISAHVGMYRVALTPGNKAERWVNYDIAVQRPNKLAFVLKDGDEITYAWVSDGNEVYTYMSALGKYTCKRAPATLNELFQKEEIGLIKGTVEYMFFLDLLMKEKPYEAMLEDVETVKFVGAEKVDHAQVNRLQFSGNGAKWDCFVQEGGQPFLRKAVPDRPNTPDSSISVTVSFDRWGANQALPDSRFKFAPPAGAKKVGSFFKKEAPPNPLLGKPAPRTKLDLLSGHKVDIASYKGKKIVMLDFWAIRCVPCVYCLPKVIDVANDYKDKGVVFVAVNDDDTAAQLDEFLNKRNLHPEVALHNHALFDAYNITTIPKTVLIDKNGIVRAMHGGTGEDLKATLSAELDAIIAGRELPPPKDEDEDQ